MRKRTVLLAAAVGTVLVVSACGDSSPNVAAPAATTTHIPSISPGPASTAPPSPSPTPNGPTIAVQGFSFTPDDPSFARGTTITLDNSETSEDHTFTVKGTKIDVVLHSGEVETLALKLKPGTYDFVCTYHALEGMTGQLTITP